MADYREFLVHQIEIDTGEMRGLVQHFPSDRWHWRLGPKLWTAWEHLNHARNVERRYLERLEGVLEHGEYVPSAHPKPNRRTKTKHRWRSSTTTARYGIGKSTSSKPCHRINGDRDSITPPSGAKSQWSGGQNASWRTPRSTCRDCGCSFNSPRSILTAFTP